MSNYYQKQDSKVAIMSVLAEKGWSIFGYKPDESDSMTDYWSPSRWEGIASKNGFVLVVDQYSTHYSSFEVKCYNYNEKGTSADNYAKIQKLTATLNDAAATENEKAVCKKKIEALENKEGVKPSYTVKEVYPTFSFANPKACTWHIEKDGEIVAKGKGLTTIYECNSRENTRLNAEKFVNKIESKINGFDSLVPVQKAVIKKVIKPVLVTDRKELKMGDVLSFEYHGHYWSVYSVNEETFSYELLGSEKRGYAKRKNPKRYYDNMTSFNKNIENGRIKIYELKEVEEVTYKTVYVKAQRKGQQENLLATEEATEATETTVSNDNSVTTYQIGTGLKGNGIEITFKEKPSEEVRTKMKSNGFKWAGKKRKSVWYAILSVETLAVAKNITGEEMTTTETIQESHEEITITAMTEDHQETTPQHEYSFMYNNQVNEFDLQYFATSTEEKDNNINSLLDKFKSVEINNDARITEADKTYCEEQERMYKEAIEAMQQTLELFKSIYVTYPKYNGSNHSERGYIDDYQDIRHIEDRMKIYKNDFISKITRYFEKTYNVTLKTDGLTKKYDFSVTYQNIIDEVFEQLGGYNFNEKAVKELKEASRNTIYNDSKITIKKAKLSIQDFVYWNSYSWSNVTRLTWGDSKVAPLFKALSHFETESTETLGYYETIYSELTEGNREYDIFSKYELDYNKVQSIKLYKNGKIDIEFQTTQQAQEFKMEYLIK